MRRPGRENKGSVGSEMRARLRERIQKNPTASRGVSRRRAPRLAEPSFSKKKKSLREQRRTVVFAAKRSSMCPMERFSRDALVPVSGAWHVSSPPDPDATCETEPRTTARRDSMRARRDSRGGRSLEHLRRKRGGASGRVLVTNFERRRVGAGGARDFVRVVAERDRWRARPRVRTSART